jgi:hypothetical protein
MSKLVVGIGHRFRDVQTSTFGSQRSAWIVRRLFVGRDKVEYANLVRASDSSEQKTLSVSVLLDPRRFTSETTP